MARKGQVSIQDSVETNEEFVEYLQEHAHQLICMEVYSSFCGSCIATGNAIRKGKLEIGTDSIAMVKAMADNIEALSRFKDKSEPVFLFIMKGSLTRAVFGANGIEICRVIEEELGIMRKEVETGVARPKRDIGEMLPEEAAKIEADLKIEEEMREASERLRVLTLVERKRRVNERLSKHIRNINYILFWPHCHQAHFDLYEKWDMINIQVGAKETMQLTEEGVKEILYMSDVDPNEACLYALLKGEALVVLFKMMETDPRNFVKIMRHALYEEIPVPKEDLPPEKQLPPIPAYERYATISKSAREVRRERYEIRMQKLREAKEDAARLAAEQARLAREAAEEQARIDKQRQEEERMARIQAGLPADPEPEPVAAEEGEGEETEGVEGEEREEGKADATASADANEPPEEEVEKVEEEEEFHSDVSVEDEEYIPPGGLFIPGLYSPPNELAKACGLAYLFPKIVTSMAPIESEHLPPHILVMFNVEKRHEVKDVIEQYPEEILAQGVFVGEDPYSAEHVAFTIKQYDKMVRLMKYKDRLAVMVSRKRSLPLLQLAGCNPCYIILNKLLITQQGPASGHGVTQAQPAAAAAGRVQLMLIYTQLSYSLLSKDRLAVMVSRKRSLPMLQLAGCNPCYISSDAACGERDCLALFPVGYGDEYEEEESVTEEEIVVADAPEPEAQPVTEDVEEDKEKNEDDEDNEEDEA